MIFTVWTGRENAQDARAQIGAWAVPTRQRKFREMHLGDASKATPITGISEVQRSNSTKARRSAVSYDAGVWFRSVYDVQDGVVIKLGIQRKQAWASMQVQASLLLHARDEAAHRRIIVPLSGHEDMAFKMHEIDGRFDILTVEEAATLGITIPAFALSGFDPVRVGRACTITEADPEISPRKKLRVREVVNQSGEKQEIVEPIRRRGLRI